MGKIDLNPFDDPGGPLEINLYASNGFDDIDIFDIDLNPFDANEALEIDINGTLSDINEAVVSDPFGTLGMVVVALTPGAQPWAYAMMSGASAAQQGGDPSEIVQAMGLSYFGSTVGDAVANQATQFLDDTALDLVLSESVNETFGATISEALGSSAGQFSRTLIHTGGNFESAANAFATGAFNQGMAEVLGGIDELLPEGKGWASLNDGVKKAITSGITTVAQGGDVTVGTLSGLVRGYSESVIPTVNNYIGSTLSDGSQLSDASIALITEGLARSLNVAVEGGDTTDAFFSRFRENADTKIREYINSAEGLNVNRRLDDLFNNTGATTTALAGLNEEYGRLLSAQTAYNTLAAEGDDLRTKANNGEIPESQFLEWFSQNEQTLVDLKAEYDGYLANIPDLSQTYIDATGNMLSDMDEFTDEFTPITEIANEVAATTLNPLQFDEAKYRELNNIGPDEDIYQHYLNNKLQADANALNDTLQAFGETINDITSGEAPNLPSEIAPIEYSTALPQLVQPTGVDTKPTVVQNLEALNAIILNDTSEEAKKLAEEMFPTREIELGSIVNQVINLSQPVTLEDGTQTTNGAIINNIVESANIQIEEEMSAGDKFVRGIKTIFGGDSLTTNVTLMAYSTLFGEQVAGNIQGFAEITDRILDVFNPKNLAQDLDPENNLWLQLIAERNGGSPSDYTATTIGPSLAEMLGVENFDGAPPSTFVQDAVRPYVQYSQEMSEDIANGLGYSGKKALEGSQYSGDIVFKDFLGFPLPVDVENVSLGENPTLYGYTLHASQGIADLFSNVVLGGIFGKAGLVAGGAMDVFEATGMAALEIEQEVFRALQDPVYLESAEYKDFLNKAGGDPTLANAQVLSEAKSLILLNGIVDGVSEATMATLVLRPVSKFGSGAINFGVSQGGISASEAIAEVFDQGITNYALENVGIPDKDLGDNLIASAIGAVAETSSVQATSMGVTGYQKLIDAIRTNDFSNTSLAGPTLGVSMVVSSISPDIAAAGSDPEAIIQNAIKADLYSDAATFVETYSNVIPEATLSTDKTFLDINNPESGYVYSEEDLELAASVDGNFVIFEQGVLPTLTGDVAYIMEDMGLTVRDIKNVGAKALEQIEANNPELFSQLLPSQKVSLQTIKNAEATNDFLQEAGLDTDTAVSVTNNVTGFDAITITPAEVTYELNTQLPGIEFSDDVVQGAIDSISGVGVDSDIATLVASYTDPYYFDTSEIIAAAQAEGITLTEEQAEAYTTVIDDDTSEENVIDTIIEDDAQVTEDEVQTIIENAIAGLPETASPQDVENAIETAISGLENLSSEDVEAAIEAAVSELENLSETDVQTIVDNAVENLATTTDVETAIQNAIDGLPETASPQDVEDAIGDALEGLENLSSEDVETIVGDAIGDLENLSEIDVQTIVDSAVENLATTTDVETAINNAIAGLPETATPDDVQNAIGEAIGELEDVSLEEVEAAIETAIGDLDNLSETDVQTIVDNTVGTLETQISEVSEDIEALDTDIGTLQTDLTNLISNVGDVDAALTQLSTDLGTSEEAILDALDTTKEELETQFSEEIADVAEDVEALGTDVDTLQTDLTNLISNIGDVDAALVQLSTDLGTSEEAILSALDTTKEELETSLGEQLTDVQTELGADIDAIAELIGKPAQEVTQVDVDFVVDLLAQESINEELTEQYDVTGDGVVTQDDVTLLDQILAGEDVTPADTSVFAPTGLYAQQAQDTQTTQDLITQLTTDISTQIETEAEKERKERQQRDALEALEASIVEVKPPDPFELGYQYDISRDSIFATPQQAQLFKSPYSGRSLSAGNANLQSQFRRAGGFAKGGQVEDENDMLLRIIGDT